MVCERILQAITKQYDQRHAFSQFMWSCRWARGKNTPELVKHPVGRGEHAL
jgi:hypothetical protein